MMKLAIEGFFLCGNRLGVGRYIYNLLNEISKIKIDNNDYFIISPQKNDFPFYSNKKFHEKIAKIPSPVTTKYFIWINFIFPLLLKKLDIELVHFPYYGIPPNINIPSVVTIHDISYKIYPQWFSFRSRMLLNALTKRAIKNAKKIIVTSNFTKNEILNNYKIREDNISIIYEGVEKDFKIRDKEICFLSIKRKYGIKRKFLLFVGSLQKRRNIPLLLNSFYGILKKGYELNLVMIGNIFSQSQRNSINKLIKKLNLKNNVFHFTFIPDEDLISFYNASEIFVYLSEYEGFGLPLLEAAACGTPIITYALSSIPELLGNAAFYIKSKSQLELEKAIINLLNNKQLREQLVQKGLERIKKFDWKITAENTLTLYNQLKTS